MSRAHRRRLRHDSPHLHVWTVNGRTYYVTNHVLRLLVHQMRHPGPSMIVTKVDGKNVITFMGIPVGPTRRIGDE